MKHLSTVLLALTLNSWILSSAPLPPQGDNKQLLRLSTERDKLKRQTNPVDRAKTGIKISEILLTLTGDAIQTGDLVLMQDRLNQYTETIREAHDTLMKTGRDPHSKPGGFKDLEIALRRQLRQLQDLGGMLGYEDRDAVVKAQGHASEIRDAILKGLFGGRDAPSAR
jgi:hypothetical protein